MGKEASVFTIQEYTTAGGAFGENPDGERFQWVAAGTSTNGGARAIPKRPWSLPGKQRIVRTDYPGAKRASAQVLGPKHEPSTLEGRWDDRYNFAGYAVFEKDRFLKMCERGNPVRVSFQQEVYDCIISDWFFEYHRDDYIKYSFTIDNYGRPDSVPRRDPEIVLSAPKAFDDANVIAQSMVSLQGQTPSSAMKGTLKRDLDTALSDMSLNMNKLADVLDTRSGVLKPIGEFKRTATMFRLVQGDATAIVAKLAAARSDLDLGIKTAMNVLDFEAWSRGMRYQARLLLGTAGIGARGMEERGAPPAIGFYRPRKGESLYAISRRFYGTPHSWRLIADRNGLSTLRLDGTERLIIPERGVG